MLVPPSVRRSIVPLTFCLSLTLLPATARAGGLSFVEYEPAPGGQTNNALKDVEEVAVSPDGANVYTASKNEDSIGVFTRDGGTGEITFLEVQEDGQGGVDGLRRASGVAVSPDGNCVYGTGEQDDGLVAFDRDGGTGALTYVETETVDRPKQVVVSGDDDHVYAVGTDVGQDGAVHVFSRTPPACALTAVEVETGDVDGLGKAPEALAISGDGAHVYVGGSILLDGKTFGTVSVLSRDGGTGALTFVDREIDGTDGVDRLETPVSSVAVSVDGANVYAVSRSADAVLTFARDGGTGELTFVEFDKDGGGNDGLNGPLTALVSADDAYVFIAARDDDSVAVFRRDAPDGALRFLDVQRDPLIDPPDLVLPTGGGLAQSPAGESLYAGAKGVTVFDADTCGDGNVGIDEHCDDGNLVGGDGCSDTCRLELCGPAPAGGCRGTELLKAQLQIKDLSPDRKDKLQFKWNKGETTPLADYGDPLTTATYLICIYDSSANPQPLYTAAAPAGGVCKKGKDCWKAATTKYKYKDNLLTPDGLQNVQLKEGLLDGKAKLQFKGKGANIQPPALPLTFPVTVQVVNTETAVCWDADFAAIDVKLNEPEKLKAKGN